MDIREHVYRQRHVTGINVPHGLFGLKPKYAIPMAVFFSACNYLGWDWFYWSHKDSQNLGGFNIEAFFRFLRKSQLVESRMVHRQRQFRFDEKAIKKKYKEGLARYEKQEKEHPYPGY